MSVKLTVVIKIVGFNYNNRKLIFEFFAETYKDETISQALDYYFEFAS